MKLLMPVFLAVLALQPAVAQDAKPTEASVRQLFEVMHTSKILDNYLTQVNTTMHASMQQAMQGKQFNPEQQQIMDDWSAELASLTKHELNWESMQPLMVEVYRSTFSQQEVDGMLKFYRSPTGQSVIAKMPAAVQQSMQSMQQHVTALTPKIAQLTQETMAAMQRAQERAATPPPPQLPQSPQPPQQQ